MNPTYFQHKKWIHPLFMAGIVSKAFNAVLEIVGGTMLGLFSEEKITRAIISFTENELSEDPRDRISHFILEAANHISFSGKTFASVYLLSHGLVKLGLIIALLKKKMWAYPLSMMVFFLFFLFQIYRFSFTHSQWLVVLSVLDIGIIIATWLEYERIETAKPR